MGHIFISYARQDKEPVNQIVQQLKNAGVDVWIDEADISPAADVPQGIADAIISAEKFFLFLSPTATLSWYVKGELNLALKHKIGIVPILITKFEIPPDFDLQTGFIQRVDLTEDLMGGVNQLLNLARAHRTKVITQPGFKNSPPQYEYAVFVSYAWGGESERTVDELEQAFAKRGIRIVRDKKDLGYKGSIKEFEQRIGQGECVILVISDKYLRSEHCMHELVEVDKNRELRERIFPIVLEDASIYKAIDRLTYIKHWDEQINKLNNAIKQIDVMTNLSGITADLDKYARIRANFDHLTDLLSDMNALTPQMHAANDFSILINAVEHAMIGKAQPDEISDERVDQVSAKSNVPLLLESLARNTSPSVTYITPELISPYEKTSHNVVIGKTISIEQIRDQRFMPRPHRLDAALRELDAHLLERSKSDDVAFSTFWIHGRSGSGKSVLLLQLMQALALQRRAQIFWLDDASETLQLLLEKWAEQAIKLDEPVFIFVDDFNTPQTRDLIDYKPISRLLRNQKYARLDWPVIVTCSPPEYLADFQSAGNNEGFRIRSWEIPTIDPAEAAELTQWFEQRTGGKPKTGQAFQETDGLAMSMMFELWYGARHQSESDKDLMRAFGNRFRARLESLDLVEVITPILALNRLYILAPKSWLDELSAEQKDALNSLNADQDFSILSAEQRGGAYIKLTHPHISDAIYKAIRSEDKKATRAQDLAFAFGRTLAKEFLIASRILRTAAEGYERVSAKDLDSDTLAVAFSQVWLENSQVVDIFDNRILAYFWTDWALWNTVYPKLSGYLRESAIVEKAANYLGSEHRFWGVLWQHLWHCAPGNYILSQKALNWLQDHSHLEDPSWSFVWRILLEYPNDLPEGTTVKSLIQRGAQWLAGREDRDPWNYVWRILLEHSDDLPEGITTKSLVQVGIQWLAGREDKDQWAFVWLILFEHKSLLERKAVNNMFRAGLNWLIYHEDQDPWSAIFEDCLRNGILEPRLLTLGIKWIIKNAKRPQVIGLVLEIARHYEKLEPKERNELQAWIKDWVYKTGYKNPQWTYGWDAYWEMMPTIQTVDLALKWIDVTPENIGVAHWLINKLFKTRRFDVLQRVTVWHDNHPDHPIAEKIEEKLRKIAKPAD